MKVNEIITEAGVLSQVARNLLRLPPAETDSEESRAAARTNPKMDPVIAKDAMQKFGQLLTKNNYQFFYPPLTDEGIRAASKSLKPWTIQYMSGDLDRDEKTAVATAIDSIPEPNDYSPKSVLNYMTQAAAMRRNTMVRLQNALPGHDVPAGSRLEVVSPLTGETYYKTGNQWTNDQGKPVTEPQNISALDYWSDSSGKMTTIPQQTSRNTRRVSRKRQQ